MHRGVMFVFRVATGFENVTDLGSYFERSQTIRWLPKVMRIRIRICENSNVFVAKGLKKRKSDDRLALINN